MRLGLFITTTFASVISLSECAPFWNQACCIACCSDSEQDFFVPNAKLYPPQLCSNFSCFNVIEICLFVMRTGRLRWEAKRSDSQRKVLAWRFAKTLMQADRVPDPHDFTEPIIALCYLDSDRLCDVFASSKIQTLEGPSRSYHPWGRLRQIKVERAQRQGLSILVSPLLLTGYPMGSQTGYNQIQIQLWVMPKIWDQISKNILHPCTH